MFNRLIQTLTIILIVVTPLFFWTLTPGVFTTSKQFIILVLGLILAITFFAQVIKDKSLSYSKKPLSLALTLFMAAIVASLIMNPEGRPESLAGKGAILLLIPLISLAIYSIKHHDLQDKVNLALIGTGTLLAIHSLAQLTFLTTLPFIPTFMQSKLFTPTGDFLTTLIIIVVGVSAAIHGLSSPTVSRKPFYLASTIIGIIGIVAIASLMLPGSLLAITLIPYRETWAITLDALKSFRSLLFGVGLSNYGALFTAVKPLSLNAGNLWNAMPQTGTSELLTIFTTTGILGGLSLIWVMILGLQSVKNSPLFFPTIILILAFIFAPGNVALYLFLFIFITAGSVDHSHISLNTKSSLAISIPLIILMVLGFAYLLKPLGSEYYIANAQSSLKNSDGKGVYDNHLKAIALYPRMTTYHLSFAETNLSLASALSQKENLTDEEKKTISTLVQQAVSEAKTATVLRPNSSLTWLTLAKIYRNLINVGQGADTFAIENYAKAVALDPANPSLRIEFGGLFYQLGVVVKEPKDKNAYFARAKTEFQTAIQLRSNFPNAYYNLSKLFETTGDYESAYLSLQKSLSLLGPDNPDLQRATAELETLKAKLPKPTPPATPKPVVESDAAMTAPSDLATPAPLASPLPGGPIEL